MRMFVSRRFLALGVSGLLHAGVIGGAFALGAMPEVEAEGLGAGAADFGGTAAVDADFEPELHEDIEAGPRAKLVSIGIVVDEPAPVAEAAPPAPPAPAPPPPSAPPPSPAPEAETVAVEAPPEPVPEPVPEDPQVAPVPSAPEAEAVAGAESDEAATGEEAAVADAAVEPLPEPPAPEEVAAAANPHKQGKSFTPSGRRPPGKGKRKSCPVIADDGVERLSPTEWNVSRDVVEHYAGNLGELMKLGSVRPHRAADGKLRGFRVAIARCSILRETGLRTGDVVETINGIEVHDLFGALGAYFKLRKETHIEVRITRRGRPITFSYELS